MPREFGGHTKLGQELNKIGSVNHGNVVKRQTTKYGIITEVLGREVNQGEYIVILDVYDADGNPQGKSRPLPLTEDPGFLATNYGAPEDLINRFWCKIEYDGPSYNRGKVTIINNPFRDREIATKFNELQVTGTAFAPPGSGMV